MLTRPVKATDGGSSRIATRERSPAVGSAALLVGVLAGVDGSDPCAVPVPLPTLPEAPAQLPPRRVSVTVDGGAAPADPSVRGGV